MESSKSFESQFILVSQRFWMIAKNGWFHDNDNGVSLHWYFLDKATHNNKVFKCISDDKWQQSLYVDILCSVCYQLQLRFITDNLFFKYNTCTLVRIGWVIVVLKLPAIHTKVPILSVF